MPFYKLVKVINYYDGNGETERYVPAFMVVYTHIIYRVDKWAEKELNNGPMCVFDTKENIYEFLKSNGLLDLRNYNQICGGYKVFECDIVPAKSKSGIYVNGGNFTPATYLPTGTILADKVKLIKEIEICCPSRI